VALKIKGGTKKMKILKFNGQLIDIMGEKDARANWETALGLKAYSGHQNTEEGITLMEVVDESKAQKYLDHPQVEVLTPEQADTLVADKMDKVTYKVTSEGIMGANLNKKVTDGILDVDAMKSEWNEQQELEYLYNQGISGIKKSEFKAKRFKVEEKTLSKS
jgi:hypothetical protein